jgi:hypothetical protein
MTRLVWAFVPTITIMRAGVFGNGVGWRMRKMTNWEKLIKKEKRKTIKCRKIY